MADPAEQNQIEFTPDDLEDLFGKGEEATEETTETEETSEEKTEETPPITAADLDALKTELAATKQSSTDSQTRVMQMMTELVKNSRTPEAPPRVDDDEEKKLDQAIAYAAEKNQKLLPQLLEKKMELKNAGKMSEMKRELLRDVRGDQAARDLTTRLLGLYEDDIRKPDSKIVAAADEQKTVLRQVLARFMTDQQLAEFEKDATSDRLAYLLAAAQNPQEVAKREVNRMRRDRADRDERVRRISSLAGGGGSRKLEDKGITDVDKELAERFNINLDDEKVKGRILKSKEEENLEGIKRL